MAYTYEEFLSKAESSGLKNQFSGYDMDLAKKYPEFGMSMLSLKQQWANATTASAKAVANEEANKLRAAYGSYTGGSDGSLYIPTARQTTASFSYADAPSYENRYASTQKELLDKVINYEPFSYDPQSDPVRSAYMKQYRREGQRSAADALAIGAQATGGIPSSYAQTAASQASDYYAAKASDIIPTLYENAYNRYLNDFKLRQAALDAINEQEGIDYSRFLDAYDQYANDRDFAYGTYADAQELASAAEQAAAKAQQQKIENALDLWKLYGYATDEVAGVLGVEPGTPTTDRQYDDWYSAYKGSTASAKSTGKSSSSAKAESGSTESSGSEALSEKELRDLMTMLGYAPSSDSSVENSSKTYTLTNKHTDSWVAIGNARYTNRELLELVLSGEVKEIRDPEKRTVTYVRA